MPTVDYIVYSFRSVLSTTYVLAINGVISISDDCPECMSQGITVNMYFKYRKKLLALQCTNDNTRHYYRFYSNTMFHRGKLYINIDMKISYYWLGGVTYTHIQSYIGLKSVNRKTIYRYVHLFTKVCITS